MSSLQLPALKDLYSDTAVVSQNQQLNILLNAEPKKEWVREHPYITNYKYIPIERIEYLLTMLFSKWRVEVKSTLLIANSIVVTIRLYYLDPVSGDWDWQDGIGASPIQTDKDAGAIDFNRMKSSAIQMSAPAAETYAIKDAAEKIGKIFGKDLNRKDTMAYADALDKAVKDLRPEIEKQIDLINQCKNKDSLLAIWSNIPVHIKTEEDVILAKDNKLQSFAE